MSTPHLDELLDDLAETLKTTGLNVTAEPQHLNPPCVWLALGNVRIETLGGSATADVQVTFIVSDLGTTNSIATLSEMIRTATIAVDFPEDIEPIAVSVPTTGNVPLPAMRTTIPELETRL